MISSKYACLQALHSICETFDYVPLNGLYKLWLSIKPVLASLDISDEF